jgi:hypothetical protein
MSFDWQTIGAVTLTLTAAGYLARLAWHSATRRDSAACGGCGNCATGPAERQIVGIDSLSRPRQPIQTER